MENEYPTLMHRWFDLVWNQKKESAIDELFAEDGIGYGLAPEIHGPKEFKPFFQNFISAYPDLHVEVLDTVTEGDKIAARCHVTGTHQGHGLNLGPTGEKVDFTGMVIVQVRDGKIWRSWNEFNFMQMYTQLKALTLNLHS
jgi:predicted ester cyclase